MYAPANAGIDGILSMYVFVYVYIPIPTCFYASVDMGIGVNVVKIYFVVYECYVCTSPPTGCVKTKECGVPT